MFHSHSRQVLSNFLAAPTDPNTATDIDVSYSVYTRKIQVILQDRTKAIRKDKKRIHTLLQKLKNINFLNITLPATGAHFVSNAQMFEQ